MNTVLIFLALLAGYGLGILTRTWVGRRRRRADDDVDPPARTREQLLAVRCTTCGAAAVAYCEQRPGVGLPLPQHHRERFWSATGTVH